MTDSATDPYLLQLQATRQRAPRFSLQGFRGRAYCDDVYDGDTCQLTFQPECATRAFRWTCRLARIQAPEMRSSSSADMERAVAARDALRQLILGSIVIIDVVSMGRYRRPVVEIMTETGVNVNDLLLHQGHVVPYALK